MSGRNLFTVPDEMFLIPDPDPKPEEAVNIDIIAPAWMNITNISGFEERLNHRERQHYHSKRIYRVYPHDTIIVGLGLWQVLRNTWYQFILKRNKTHG